MSIVRRFKFLLDGLAKAIDPPSPLAESFDATLPALFVQVTNLASHYLAEKNNRQAHGAHAVDLYRIGQQIGERIDRLEERLDPRSPEVTAEVGRVVAHPAVQAGLDAIPAPFREAFNRAARTWRPSAAPVPPPV